MWQVMITNCVGWCFIIQLSSFSPRRVFVGWKRNAKKSRATCKLYPRLREVCLRSLSFPLRFFPIPELAGFAAGNFNLHCHSTQNYHEIVARKCDKTLLLDFAENAFKIVGSDLLLQAVDVISSRWQMKSFSTWHLKNLKTLWLVQAAVATWKRDPSRFVLYCGNICSLHYKTIIVETITLHAFIFKRTACFDDCPLFSTIFKRRTAGWHFVDLWTETFKPQAKKRNFKLNTDFSVYLFLYIFWPQLLEISCCKMFNIPP